MTPDFRSVALCVPLALFAASAQAGTFTFLAGDIDCFGAAQGNCDAGAFPAIPAFDNTEPGDPPGTDVFDALGTVTLAIDGDLTGETLLSALLEVRVAGVDIFAGQFGTPPDGMGFAVNGNFVGAFVEPVPPPGSNLNQRAISTLAFNVDLAFLDIAGPNVVTVTPEQDFGLGPFEAYAIDFARLTVETDDAQVVPVPAALPLMAAALGLLGWVTRARRTTR